MNQQFFFPSTFHSVAQQYFNRDNFCVVSWRMVWNFFISIFHNCSFMYQQTKQKMPEFFSLWIIFIILCSQNIIRECWNEIAWIVCAFYIVNINNIVLFGNPLNRINHFHKQSYESSLNFKLNLDDLIKKFFILFRIFKFVYDNFVYR